MASTSSSSKAKREMFQRQGSGIPPADEMAKLVKVIGAGTGGVDEMREYVNDATVQFALLRFTFGSGSFKRNKLIFVHVNGENCSAVKKGRMNTKKSNVKNVCGSTHAEIQFETSDDCAVDNVLHKLSKVITVDEGGSFSIAQMKKDYEKMIERNRAAAVADTASSPGGGKRKTAADFGATVEAQKALDEVRKPLGHFNWALFRADKDLKLYNAGSLSINEMREWLKDDEVLFGIVRMGFGSGKFRRIKWIHIRWKGPSVSAVARGKMQAKSGEMHDRLSPFSVTIEANSLEDCALESIIERVQKTSIVDGGGGDSDQRDKYSMKDFLEALEEEKKATAEFFGDVDDGTRPPEPAAHEAIQAVRTEGGAKNWVLLELK